MANYEEYCTYFTTLAKENKSIQHDETNPKGKKFFRMNIEEFYTSGLRSLTTTKNEPFIVFINYITDYAFTHQQTKGDQLMFMVLANSGQKNDYDAETEARTTCEAVAEQFLAKIKHDSESGHALFKGSADRIMSRMVPTEIRYTNIYIGWQISITLNKPTTLCHNSNNWL